MIWANNISELQYYNQPPNAPCYCEHLVYPSDLILQGSFNSPASSGFSLVIEVLSADGLSTYEDATTYFQYYFFPFNGKIYFNIQLKTWSPAMCEHECWILRVRAYISGIAYFDKYTQRYCQADCCDIPRGITIETDGVTTPATNPSGTTSTTFIPRGSCGKPLIRIEVEFPCIDANTADYYGLPSDVYSGTANFSFKKVTNFVGKIRQRPREIVREISYSCSLQRSESFIPFEVESTTNEGVFPLWKLNEIEVMFHAPEIYISDFISGANYQFAGGTISQQVYKCWELFKLKTIVQSCTVRQVFGCDDNCDQYKSYTFLIPNNAQGSFYSENRTLIGGFEDLIIWFAGQENVVSVDDVSEDYDNVYGAIEITGSGLLPNVFYYDTVTPRNRIYGTNTPVSPVVICNTPVAGEVTIEESVCQTPETDTIIIETTGVTVMEFAEHGDWDIIEGDTSGSYTSSYANFSIRVENDSITVDPEPFFTNELIAFILPDARPSTVQSIEYGDAIIVIDTEGRVFYTGAPTSIVGTTANILITNVYYNL